MKKVLFLMLFLMILGAAGVSAQVRIGGDAAPHDAAVLDLNADGTSTGTKGLALPRVSLSSNTVILAGATNLKGMLVYNTNTTAPLSEGPYYWNGSVWVPEPAFEFITFAVECSTCNPATAGTVRSAAISFPTGCSVGNTWTMDGAGAGYWLFTQYGTLLQLYAFQASGPGAYYIRMGCYRKRF